MSATDLPSPIDVNPASIVAKQLTMRQACEILGGEWVNEKGEATTQGMRRLRDRLRSVERSSGIRLVFGGKGPKVAHTRKGGGRCWTTFKALERASLANTEALIHALVPEWVDRTNDRVVENSECLDLLDGRVSWLKGQVKSLKSKVDFILANLG